MTYNDTIRKGATHYRVGTITHAAGEVMPDDATIRASILTLQGAVVASWQCAVLDRDDWTFAMNMPRATTDTLTVGKYPFRANYDQGENTDPIASGYVTVEHGLPLP